MSLLSKRAEQYVREHMDELILLTGALCAIPAPTRHEEERAAFCIWWLRNHGIDNAYIDEAKNVIWPYQCEGKCSVTCLAAHTDTVFPDRTPFRMDIRDGRASGSALSLLEPDHTAMLYPYLLENSRIRAEVRDGRLVYANIDEALIKLEEVMYVNQ